MDSYQYLISMSSNLLILLPTYSKDEQDLQIT